jgi:MobA/MobL family
MAIFHLNAKVISRGKGQSAIAAAAYRSGDRLRDEQTGEQKFYKTSDERVQFTDIMAPKDAPEWAHDRNRLWNEAGRAEKRKDSQLAREIEVSLPHELTGQQREWLVKDFAREAFVRRGYAVDIAIHAPYKDSDDRNHHAHLMVTMRTLGPEGFAATKDRALNGKAQLGEWREQWAHLANRHLERHGHEARIDHRSLKEQGTDREPTMHLGYAANEMSQRGAQSDRMDALQDILSRNEIRVDMKACDAELQALEREEALRKLGGADHADTQTLEKPRDDALRALQRADRADREGAWAAKNPAEQAFGDSARAEAQEIRQERREAIQDAQQEAWREYVSASRTSGKGRAADDGGIKVTNGLTGAISGLGDFIIGILAGPSQSSRSSEPDMGAFVSDSEARKRQQFERLEAKRAAAADLKARERMGEDLRAGRNLNAEDIMHLSHEHQLAISQRGDDAVRDMVEEARKFSARHWKGEERERDR